MSLAELAQWPVENAAGALLRTDDARTVDGYGDLDAEYELASVTKLLVAYGILVAIEEEAIRLDQPVGPPGSTVEHLLAHASGLAFDSDEVVAAPATQRIYSSYGYELVARLVEEETGIGFPDYLREAVFGPLGMTRSSLPGPAGHGARSTVADLTRFAAEVAAPTLLDPRTVGGACTVHFPGLAGFVPGYGKFIQNTWGLGFEIKGDKRPHWTGTRNSPRTVGHFGQAGTYLWIDPDLQLAAVILTDRPFGAWAKPLWSEFNDRLISQELQGV
ncbi:serine hydrolase domain-containing protein [Tsukamurella paurometabola]|uniref:Beta-lactamase n=1 Tax=Tsukamurella paurometabola (strain ATCC 8368 / DSM 20162 / CCUG 35730 / CIP 100753 / JCM 10117 / KCTC 9821 / NBRC 16120 / NCIMB 702349 / NCTC 13040) TaxID=521096 RepID=D5USQ6_TSUPD|nr:serine hydrolase domain-containing protein [Tsukamurella paurometabola]ADG79327.1 beta-lactamase [Tsukamurella paurometabola DSM 20162]SUP35101.1 Penicillin-binding protein E [Tsukamurella paurometabola]